MRNRGNTQKRACARARKPVAHIALERISTEVRDYLRIAGYTITCFPASVAASQHSWNGHIKKLQSESSGWEEGDIILYPRDAANVDTVKAALAAGQD